MEVGQICKKVAGSESGRYCVIYHIEGNFAEITGIGKYKMCKRRRCNLKHLKPTKYKIKIESDKQEDIEKKLLGSGLIAKLGLLKEKDQRKKTIEPKKMKEREKRLKQRKEAEAAEKEKGKRKESKKTQEKNPKAESKKSEKEMQESK